VQYALGNPFADIVGGEWLEQTNEDLIEHHREQILKLFHHPNNGSTTTLEEGQRNRAID
jgi:hypothetical protein